MSSHDALPRHLPSAAEWPDGADRVIVIDEADRALGTASKREAHVAGILHRAFSVFVIDAEGRVLLQRRASDKYHSGGLWTNTACGHPRPGEDTAEAAARRLREEMGIRCAIEPAGAFHYRATLANGLIEHELDHVFVGHWSGVPAPDPREAEDWRWVGVAALREEVQAHPDRFTAWLVGALERALAHPLLRAA